MLERMNNIDVTNTLKNLRIIRKTVVRTIPSVMIILKFQFPYLHESCSFYFTMNSLIVLQLRRQN